MYDINIVIVNWVERDNIKRCLASLYEDIKGDDLKVIVHIVDNSGNIDGIKELLKAKFPQAVYKDAGGNIGFGKAQNLGFSMAEARFYLALNPDMEFLPKEHAIKRMVEFLDKNPKIGMASPKLLNFDGTIQNSCFRFPGLLDQIIRRLNLQEKYPSLDRKIGYYLMRDFNHRETVPVDWIMGSFIMVKAEVVKKIGFFDDNYFMYFEDCDWCRRVWVAGWKVFYVHDVKVKHLHRRESAKKSPWIAVIQNPVARMHLMSWFRYFKKWGTRRVHYGD